MVYTLRFLSSSKYSLFHNSNVFGSCVIHILYTGCAKIRKNNSGVKSLNRKVILTSCRYSLYFINIQTKKKIYLLNKFSRQQFFSPTFRKNYAQLQKNPNKTHTPGMFCAVMNPRLLCTNRPSNSITEQGTKEFNVNYRRS
jgi:hypothetical protein